MRTDIISIRAALPSFLSSYNLETQSHYTPILIMSESYLKGTHSKKKYIYNI